MFDLRHAILAYWRVRQIRTRAQCDAVARRRLARWLRQSVPRVPFYQGRVSASLADLPIVDKATQMADFGAFNRAGITDRMGWEAFAGSKHIGPLIVGASTGTSGNRGLFVISQAERFRWLGTILAKAVPGFWRMRHRVAVLLPLNTPLYDSANRFARLNLRFFDLADDWAADLCGFDPTIIIAPPKVLRLMAEQRLALRPKQVFAGAEALDALDRAIVAEYFGQPVGQIYMATEGLFAVSCAQGTLHLCEDTMHFELPPFGDDPDLREVIISDFSRDVQIMARYRMNDLIRLGPPCPCGLPQRSVAEVVGRADDCFDFAGTLITPDILRNAVVDADRRITDFRVVQTGAARIEVSIPPGCDIKAVRRALEAVLQRKAVHAEIDVTATEMFPDMSRKLRRVENRFGRSRP
ncbi:MAG: CoF synthetase [Yoonia sp.]|uniref:CoF synthetase n=1 Tax=Yoonia sp. TaxID=2212373 RepID=UPI002740146F|nr:CoF synthetase [Yoonia sp.]MDP5084568.1 CoF synthetase [Yoonia sp.]